MDAEYEMALSSRLQRSKRPLTPLGRDGTVPLDETYAETVNHYGRIFQQHALASKTYFAPIDEVCCLVSNTNPYLALVP